MKRLFALLCTGLLLAAAAHADELTAQKRADIDRLLELTGASRAAEQMASQMAQTLRQSLGTCTNCTPRMFEIIDRETSAQFREGVRGPDGMLDRLATIYHSRFSHAEIRQLVSFYETPLGQRLLSETPQIAREGLVASQQWAQSMRPLLELRLKAAFEREKLPLPTGPTPQPANP